jgi:hypothetical protein
MVDAANCLFFFFNLVKVGGGENEIANVGLVAFFCFVLFYF